MDADAAIHVARQAVYTGLLLAAPALAVSLVVGLTTAVFQAVTSVREMTLAIIPKLIAVALTVVVCLGWMIEVIITFTTGLFQGMGVTGG